MSKFIYNNYLIGGAQPLIVNQKYNLLTSTSSPDTNIDADGELDNGKAFQNITITKIVPNKYLKHITDFTLKDPNNQAKSIQHDSRHNHYKLKTSGGKVNIVQIKDSDNKDIYVAPIVDAVLKAKQEINRKKDRKFVEEMRNKAIAQQAAAKKNTLQASHGNVNYKKGSKKPKLHAKVHNLSNQNKHHKHSPKPSHHKHSPKPSHHKHHGKTHGKPHHKPHHGKPHHKPHHQKPQPQPKSQSQFTSYVYQADPEAEAKAAREEAIRRNKARQKHKVVSYTYHR